MTAALLLGVPSIAWGFDSRLIDAGTALISSPAAPLAARGGDAAAVWCTVPPGADGSVLVYLHGNDGFVTASASQPRGYVPAWAPRWVPPTAVGPAYQLAELSQAGTVRPVVMAPEIGVPDDARAAWAVTAAGRFDDPSDPDPLGTMVKDTLHQLAGLGLAAPLERDRLVVAAHSGGGRVVGALLDGEALRRGPVDLWMLDATYGWGTPEAWVKLVSDWRAARPGPSSRLVLVYVDGTGTAAQATALITALRASGAAVGTATWGTPGLEDVLVGPDVVGLAIPKGVVGHGAVPIAVLPTLFRTVAP